MRKMKLKHAPVLSREPKPLSLASILKMAAMFTLEPKNKVDDVKAGVKKPLYAKNPTSIGRIMSFRGKRS